MNEKDMVTLGKHKTISLGQNVVFSLERPYPNAWHIRIQVSQEVWFRCDGEDPAPNAGFCIDKHDGILCVPVCNDNFKIISSKLNCRVQIMWVGTNGSLING